MPKMTTMSIMISILSVVMTASCGPPPECREFFDLTSEQQENGFKGFPIEKQLDVFLCGMKIEPPETKLARYIADQGEDVVAPTVDRLKASKSLADQSDLIYLLVELSDRGYLKGRKDVVADISNVIDTMKLDNIRNENLKRLGKIQINSGVPPFTYTR